MDFLKKSIAGVASLAFAAAMVFAPLPALAQLANPQPAASLSQDGVPVNIQPGNHICGGPTASQVQDCVLGLAVAYTSGGCTTTPALIGGPDAFQVTNGASGCSGSTMVLTMPYTAAHKWVCGSFTDTTSPTTTEVEQSAATATTVTVTNYTRTTGAVLTWVASDVIIGSCNAF